MVWKAYIYQVGDGEIDLKKYKLNELKPYTTDMIEKVDKKSGATYFWLQKMKKTVPPVTADAVEVWGNDKRVKVLIKEGTCTLLKSGYDSQVGDMIFRPLPHDRINMIKSEMTERKERIQDKKDVLAAIAPFVMTGVLAVALVIGVYIIVQGAVENSKNNMEGSTMIADSLKQLTGAVVSINGNDPNLLNELSGKDLKEEEPPPANIPP